MSSFTRYRVVERLTLLLTFLIIFFMVMHLKDESVFLREEVESLKEKVTRQEVILSFQREKFPPGLTPEGRLAWFIEENNIDPDRLRLLDLDRILLKTPVIQER